MRITQPPEPGLRDRSTSERREHHRELDTDTDRSVELDPELIANGASASLVIAFSVDALDGHRRISLRPEGTVVGRSLPIFDGGAPDTRMSRHHAELRRIGERWSIHELASRNRTRVNGREIDGEVPLEPGDVIRLGATLFVFSDAPAPSGAADTELVGQSAAMHLVRNAVDAVAPTTHTVLITGETGAGKEVVAQAIHRRSGRAGRFVALNCGGLAPGILESELFGHKRGAFTGAVDHEGLFRASHGGTLFLDELGEMPEELQPKLLRALQERKVRPVGASQEIPVDVRIVAATNRDLAAAVRLGKFRMDLYSRVAKWPIALPPLRRRREDIPLLGRHFLARNGQGGRPLDPALVEALLLHDWPFNVRGLESVLTIAPTGLPPGAPLTLTPQVESALAAERALEDQATPAQGAGEDDESSKPRTPPREELLALLGRHQGVVADVARHYGRKRQQVYRWIERYAIDLSEYRPPRDGT
ncbi:sigma 54-interacting transcriptional regulator [Myxococcota bacterium]|nr:sigma 54-interacting transcriptional regulator [Myxococcota bacterium]